MNESAHRRRRKDTEVGGFVRNRRSHQPTAGLFVRWFSAQPVRRRLEPRHWRGESRETTNWRGIGRGLVAEAWPLDWAFCESNPPKNKTQWTRLKKFQKDDRYQLTLVSIYSFTAFPNRGSPPISTKKGPNRPAAPSSGEIQLLDARHDNADGLCAAASRQDHPWTKRPLATPTHALN